MKTAPDLLQPQRSAHASIRGYLYQFCLSALRWLQLGRNEIIVFEGNEDIDRFRDCFILQSNLAVYEQVKDLSGPVDVRHESVRKTLASFLISYAALHPLRDEESRFIFTTTARFRRRMSTGVDVLADWNNQEKRPAIIEEVQSLLLSSHAKKKPTRRRTAQETVPDLPAAIDWLNGAPGRWDGFFDAVEWRSEATDLPGILHLIKDNLSNRSNMRDIAEDLTFRLVMEVILASSQAEPAKRCKDRNSLEKFIRGIRKELAGWQASPATANLRTVLDETIKLDRILKDPREDSNFETVRNRPGKLLPACYETVPFDVGSRQEELKKLEDWCDRKTDRSVWLIYGDGGSGKTRLMLEWCQRLEDHGWHARFLDTETAYALPAELQPLLEGVAPRLIVVDYAEQHPEAAQRLIRLLSKRKSGPKVRLVLLTRRVPDWWRKLRRKSEALDDLLPPEVSPEPLRLLPLFPPGSARIKALTKAIQVFADILGKERPAGDFEAELERPIFNNALYLYMEALSIVYGDAPERRNDILETILVHEQRFWDQEIKALNLEPSKSEDLEDAIGPMIAAITLLGEVSLEREGKDLVESVIGGTLLSSDLVQYILRILRRICGNANSCTALQPDLLGEKLIESILKERAYDAGPKLLTRVFEGAQDTRALLNLTKTSMRLLLRRGTAADPAVGVGRLEHGLWWLETNRKFPAV